MSSLNQDIQASFQIINLLEKSKHNSEMIIETLPDVFLVITEHGKIFKANKEAARLLNVDAEELIGFSFASALKTEAWNIISSNLSAVKNNRSEPVSFEMPLFYNGADRVFSWSLSFFGEFSNGGLVLFSMQARDITLLRLYQKKINDIFVSIPLSIMTVNSMGTIDDTFSEYSKWMFGRPDIGGKTIKEFIYDPGREFMDDQTREGFKALMGSLHLSLIEFSAVSETFPKQFYYPLPHSITEEGRHLGLKVQSISSGDRVAGLLLIFEDRTLIVEAEKADERLILMRNQSIERAIQLKNADPDLLDVVLSDLSQQFRDLGDHIITNSSEGFVNVLHSVKSNSRLVGLTNLQKITNSFESKLRESDTFNWELVYSNFETLQNEWREIYSLSKVLKGTDSSTSYPRNAVLNKSAWTLFKRSKSDPAALTELEIYLKSISKMAIGTMEVSIGGMVSKAAELVNKKVKIEFEWQKDLELDIDILTGVRTCLLHLVNNAIDHGVEAPNDRIQKGKLPTGTLRLGTIHSDDIINIYLEDDGRGLNRELIEHRAIDQGIINVEQSKKMSDNEIFDLIFSSKFSTAKQMTELSGRGVGLSAVREICMSFGGSAKVGPGVNGGTRFDLQFSLKEQQNG